MNNKRLCIAGGGTGGHVMPALALADAVRQRWADVAVHFIGAERGMEARLLPERGEAVLLLQMHAVQGVSYGQKLRVVAWEIPRAVWRIRRYWKQHGRPDVLVGVGGYASATGVLAALLSGIPVVLYEQNAVPGLVNRTLARFCHTMMLGFGAAAKHVPYADVVETGNIVRQSMMDTHWQAHQPPCLLVTGGSQGALFLNETVPEACVLLKQRGYDIRVLHLCGRFQNPQPRLQEFYQQAGIDAEVLEFCSDMPSFYAQADMMIARAGAMTVSEAAAVGMPCIFVPLPHAADQHQWHNAQALSQHGAALCVSQHETSANDLADVLEQHLCQVEVLEDMHHAARQALQRDATSAQLQVLQTWFEDKP